MNIRCSRSQFALLILTTAAGCTSNRVQVDQLAGASPSRCNRIAWVASGNDSGSLTDQRIHDATFETLRVKGYAVVEREADCELSYAIAISNRPQSRSSFSFGLGGGSGNVGAGAGVTLPLGKSKLRSATVRLNLTDNLRHAQIWTASYDTAVADPVTTEQANKIVSELLKKFPSPTTSQ